MLAATGPSDDSLFSGSYLVWFIVRFARWPTFPARTPGGITCLQRWKVTLEQACSHFSARWHRAKLLENLRSAPHRNAFQRMPEACRAIRLAWRRFLLGYPPRKANDTSIGDAVNWESETS